MALLLLFVVSASQGQIPITSFSTPLAEDFNTLANAGTSAVLPVGWYFSEASTNANTNYTAGNGSSTTGDTYSFGTTPADRAFGGLQSGSLNPTIGAQFLNNTGGTISTLDIAYTGEQWRLGATGRIDEILFWYSANATSLTTGTWTAFTALDFTAPVQAGTVGALDGNLSANKTVINSTVNGLSILSGTTFWIRWTDRDASGSDDGLAIDDFSISALPVCTTSVSSFLPATAPAGTIVTISGTNFTGASGVYFNNIAATSFTVVNSTTIIATVPAGVTTGPVSVQTSCLGISTIDFNVITRNCGEAKNLIISELCDPLNGFQTDRFIEIYNPTSSTINLTGWEVRSLSNGSIANACANDISLCWPLSGFILPGQALTCGYTSPVNGGPHTFTNASWVTTDPNRACYTWNGQYRDGAALYQNGVRIDGIVRGNSTSNWYGDKSLVRNSNICSPNANSSYTEWTATPVTSASAPGATPRATPLSHAVVCPGTSPDIITQPTSQTGCEGGSVSISVTGSSGTPPFNFQWNFFNTSTGTWDNIINGGNYSINNASPTSTLTISNIPLSFSGYQFYCEVSNSGDGCYKATNAVQLTVNPAPLAPTVGTITQPTCAVPTGSVILSGLPAGNWTINSGGITGNTSSTTISGLAPGTYTFTVTNSAGCPSPSTISIVIDPVPIGPTAPIIGIIIQPTCAVPTGTITLSGLPAIGTWLINPIGVSGTGTTTILTGVLPGGYTFTVTNAGCTSPSSLLVTINAVPPAPQAPTYTVDVYPTCGDPTGIITITTPIGYEYSLDGGQWQSTLTFTGVTAVTTHQLTVRSTTDNTCVSPATSFNLSVPAPPVAPTIGPFTQPTCTVPAVTIVITAPLGPTLQYSINGVIYQASPTFTAVGPGSYNVTVRSVIDMTCVSTATVVMVNSLPNITPTFNAIAPICSGGTLTALPTTSTNGITGTWSPALNNTATTTYTFTPTSGQCATQTTLTIVVNPNITPTFTAVAPICSGVTLTPLPTTSNNGINGTWNPVLNNTATTTYTFTPTSGQCATATTLTITINPNVTPTFTAVAPICSGATLTALPTTSNNGINGTWSPVLNNTATTTYTFTPTAGQCATATTLTITINPNVTPTFTAVVPICSGGTLTPLPTTSNNGINGTWSPALNNTATTTYTFTPSAGQCAIPTTLIITVNPNVTPTFNPVAPICSGATLTALPTTSLNGIAGSWSPALNNTTTTTYIFTTGIGQCATPTTLTITVNPNITPTFTVVLPICSGGTLAALPTTSLNGIAGSWSPVLDNTATTTYTFTPTAGQCATSTTLIITVNPTPTAPTVGPITQPTCTVATGSAILNNLPTGSWTINPGTVTGTGTTATISGLATGTYNFTVTNAAGCISPASADVVINAQPATPTAPTIGPIDCTLGFGNAVITVTSPTGAGLEYRLDAGTYQTSTTFTAVTNGSHTITVRNAAGCTTTGPSFIVSCGCVNGPVITLSNTNGSTCGITPVTVSGNTFSNATLVTITTNGAGSVSPLSASVSPFSFTYTPATGDAGNTVTITITTNNPLGSPCAAATINYTLVVNPTPAVPAVGAITQPTCTVVTGSVVLNNLPAGSWTINPGAIAGTGSSAVISGLAAGTYNYTVTNAAGCISPASANIVINAQPLTPAAPAVGTITQLTCTVATGSVVLNNLPAGNWIINPGAITGNTASTTITGLAAGTYSYTVTNAVGCTSPASANIVINAQPLTPAAPAAGTITQPTCTVATGSVVLNNLPTGNWTINPGAITGNTASTTITGLAAGTYNYTVTNAAGCTSPASANIVINAQPATPATPTIGPIDCTLGFGNAVVTVTSPTGAGLEYRLDAGTYQTGTTFTGVGNGNHTITVRNIAGCTTTGPSFTVSCGCANGPVLVLSSITGSTCGIIPVTVNGNTFSNATNVTITENGAGSVSPASITVSPFSFTYTPAAGDAGNTVTITLTTNNPLGAPCAAAVATYTLQVNAAPTVTAGSNSPQCAGSALNLSSSPGGAVTYSWTGPNGFTASTQNPSITNVTTAASGTYSVTVTEASGCSNIATTTVTINPTITPAFAAIGPLCQNSPAPPLPTTSTNGVSGTWIPAAINTAVTGTTNYTFIPSASCASSTIISVVITNSITPNFTQINPLCLNSIAPALPTTSTNGVTGTWSPAMISTATAGTTTYTFTPSSSCAVPTTMSIVVTGTITPTFTQIGPLCQNSTAPALPPASTNGVSGLWSPATISTATAGTTNYTFTPSGGCATSTTMSIVITNSVTPAFTQIAPLCQNSTAPALPATSTNGVSGTWNPATINTATTGTTTYTFTPSGGCAITAMMSIVITAPLTPTFIQVNPLCQNSTAPSLPTTSTNNVSGTWSPATINTATIGTTTYTFTPSAGCATTATMSIVITAPLTPTFTQVNPLCQNSTAPVLPIVSTNTIAGTWNPAIINTSLASSTTYTFTPTAGQCAVPVTMNVVVTAPIPGVRYTSITAQANTPVQLTARNIGANYLWTPPAGLNSTTIINPVFNYNLQTEYTIKITTSGGCITTDTILIKMPVQLPPPTGTNILVPKAWSPNGDGHNDKLQPFTVNIKELKYFRIFNRWGQLVFETNSIGQGWDGIFKGQPQPLDTYQWIAEGIGNDGQPVKRAGNSVLLR